MSKKVDLGEWGEYDGATFADDVRMHTEWAVGKVRDTKHGDGCLWLLFHGAALVALGWEVAQWIG